MEKALVDALSEIFGKNVFPYVADINTPTPFCIWRQIGGMPLNYLGDEYSGKKNALIEVVVCTYSRLETAELMRKVENRLVIAPLHATVMDGMKAIYDEETKLRAATQEFSIWTP